jgi:hypothetical protein
MTFFEIEDILGLKLPNSAYNHTAWWNPNGYSYCQSLIQTGFSVLNVTKCIRTEIVTLERV